MNGGEARGANRLIIDAIVGVVDLVEEMHCSIARVPGIRPRRMRTTGITRLVYRSTRGVCKAVGYGLDKLLSELEPAFAGRMRSPRREAVVAALNGVLGDYLAASHNPLAITMRLRRGGIAPLAEREESTIAQPSGKLVVLLHGLCMNDLQWKRHGHDHGEALARDLGYAPVYLHYNSGLHVSTNGRAFANMLEDLVRRWPVPVTELVFVGYSMGGLVARSACHYGAQARHDWLRRLDKIVFIGTPHHGAPLERGGNQVDALLGATAYSAPLARLGKVRSAGITDLRFGNLVDEDWKGRDRFRRGGDSRVPVPLPEGVTCYAIAATKGRNAGNLRDRLIGDGIVPPASALGHHSDRRLSIPFDESRQWIARDANHLDLLGRDVYPCIRRFLREPVQQVRAPR